MLTNQISQGTGVSFGIKEAGLEDGLPARSEIFEYWKDRLPQLGLLIDWGEPGCWTCGFHYGCKYDIKRSDVDWETILRCWDRIPLQRCHIVPRSLQGTDLVENLFLMCRECHDTMPNTSIPEIFYRWTRTQNFEVRENSKIFHALKSFGIAEKDYESVMNVMLSEQFKSWANGKRGIHRPQSRYAPISSRLTPATTIGLAVHYLEINRLNKRKRANKSCT